MANSTSAKQVATQTLSANAVDLVLLTTPSSSVVVTNETGNGTIFFTVSEPGGPCPVPTVNGVNCYAVASVAGAQTAVRHYGRYGSVVQLISTGTPTYSVVVGSPKVSI